MSKFVASYSGGKDSALAIHRAVAMGHQLMAILTTYNTDKGRSWFHGIPEPLLHEAGKKMGVPHILIKTSGEDYNSRFEEVLNHCRQAGAELCVFGDIDIADHKKWGEDRAAACGLRALSPLWNESRRNLVCECIDKGFTATITVVDTKRLPETFLGKTLSHDILAAIEKTGADVCGENGEYHSFVSGGPIFSSPLSFTFGTPLKENAYAILPVLDAT